MYIYQYIDFLNQSFQFFLICLHLKLLQVQAFFKEKKNAIETLRYQRESDIQGSVTIKTTCTIIMKE